MEEKILKKLIKLSDKAYKNGDIPVACIITKNCKIISAEYNKKYLKNDPTAHAEILAIKKACKKLKTTNLIDCELFVTLFPCNMCNALINEVRIKKVNYILNKEKEINNTIIYKQMFNNKADIFRNKIKKFFLDKR